MKHSQASHPPRSVRDYVNLLDSGAETAVSLLQKSLQRIKAYGDEAVFISMTEMRAQEEALASDARRKSGQLLGPLDGVPVAWKDLFDTKGSVTTAGAKIYADRALAKRDADVVDACKRFGIVCVGKTNLSEFAYSGLGLNPHFGTPVNPHSQGIARVPGGSSSGSAVAVAAGLVPLSVGTDTAGSVRVPASFCGITGFKASQNRYNKGGVFPLSDSLDSLGVFAHCIDDIMAMDAAMRGTPLTPFEAVDVAKLEIVVPQSVVFDGVEPRVLDCFENTLERLGQAGVTISKEPFTIFEDVADLFAKHGTLTVAEAATLHQSLLKSTDAKNMDQRVRERMETASNFSAQDYIHLQSARSRLQAEVSETLRTRFLFFPTVAITAPPLEALEVSDDLFVSTNLMALRNTMLGSYLGTPGVSLPIGTDWDGLPMGALLSAPFGHDDKVLEAARSIESILS